MGRFFRAGSAVFRFLLCVIGLQLAGCNWEIFQPYQTSPLHDLSVRLNSVYKRSLENNNYSIYYESVPPSTILVKVRYEKSTNMAQLRSIARAAAQNARDVAISDYKLSISTQIDMKPAPE